LPSGRNGLLSSPYPHSDAESVSGTLRSTASGSSSVKAASGAVVSARVVNNKPHQHGTGSSQQQRADELAELIDQKNRDFLSAISQLVDLTLYPPYHKPPPGFEVRS
jgi:hypothetical protein